MTLYCVNGYWVLQQPTTATTKYSAIASGWNNTIAEEKGQTILRFDVNPLGDAVNYSNLASTANATALMVKYNGKTFFELYNDKDNANHSNYIISYAHGNNCFYFTIPEADLVEGAILEIEDGTPFMNEYLAAVKFKLVGGQWKEVVEINYNPDFVSIGAVNQLDNNPYWGLSLTYDTVGFAEANKQDSVTSYTGITLNKELMTIPPIFWGGEQLLFWLPKEKCEAGYKGYSHATLVIKEGATVTNDNGETFTLGGVTLYLVNGAWTTEKPDGYVEGEIVIPKLGTPDCVFSGIGMWNNNNGMTLLQFHSFKNIPTEGTSYLDTTGYYIEVNGVKLMEIPGANVYTWPNMLWLRLDIPNPVEGSILTIAEGTPFVDNYLPALVFKFVDGVWCPAFTVNIEINGETHTVYSQNDVPVILNDAYFEALMADAAVPGKVVSFSTRDVTYPAGTTFKALTDTNISVEVIGFNTCEGAAVRLSTPTGIRFETHVDKADYDRLVALYGEANVQTGTYIVPKALLAGDDFRAYFADSAKIDGVDYVKIVNSGFVNRNTSDADGYYQYYGSLVNILPNNYCTDFFGIGYIQITDGDNVYTVFGGYDLDSHTRNIAYVSAKAYDDYASGTTERTSLKGYLDGVLCIADEVEISNIMDVKGYTSPYSISYDEQTGVYTVTGNAEIKSVMFGGKKRTSTRISTLKVGGELYYVIDFNLTASSTYSTLTFKLSPVEEAESLVDFTLEVPSIQGVKILQITDTELTDSSQMRTANVLSSSQKEEYARKNIYANCFNYITELVEREKPDLIILTGDLVNGSFDDNGTMWLRLIEFMDSFNIPWAPVFGALDNQSAKGAAWQREQLALSKNCLFKAGSATGNGDYTIGITDGGVLRRVIYMLDGSAEIVDAQVNWMKGVALSVEAAYGEVPAFVFSGQNTATDCASDFAAANVDGVFMSNKPEDNSTTLVDGIYFTYGTKTGSYGEHNEDKLGGTFVTVTANGAQFAITTEILDKTTMKNKESIHLVERYDGSSVVTDAYLAPIWDTNRIYDETGLFVGETGSVKLMFTPTDPKEVVVRDFTLGVTYTYGTDYTISGNKVTRVAGGNLPYLSFDEYYRTSPAVYNGKEQGWRITLQNGKTEDGYSFSGTRYMYYDEGYNGGAHHVTFTYNKSAAWTGTTFEGDASAQSFIEKLKTDKAATVMFYGDSITVGCNASGTTYGGLRNPFLPTWTDLVVSSLENLYGAKIAKYNGAVGGWTTAQGAENLAAKVTEAGTSLADVDLFVIAFGMNDPVTAEADYVASIKQMINAYYAENPNGSVLLVSPMQPNTQSSMVAGNQNKWENALNGVKNSAEYNGKNISLARVFTMFSELLTVSGKLSRDYLGNNINHPNDFGVRIYTQVILKTLCGDDFS